MFVNFSVRAVKIARLSPNQFDDKNAEISGIKRLPQVCDIHNIIGFWLQYYSFILSFQSDELFSGRRSFILQEWLSEACNWCKHSDSYVTIRADSCELSDLDKASNVLSDNAVVCRLLQELLQRFTMWPRSIFAACLLWICMNFWLISIAVHGWIRCRPDWRWTVS